MHSVYQHRAQREEHELVIQFHRSGASFTCIVTYEGLRIARVTQRLEHLKRHQLHFLCCWPRLDRGGLRDVERPEQSRSFTHSFRLLTLLSQSQLCDQGPLCPGPVIQWYSSNTHTHLSRRFSRPVGNRRVHCLVVRQRLGKQGKACGLEMCLLSHFLMQFSCSLYS